MVIINLTMTESGFLELKETILRKLAEELDPRLSYHSVHHTKDVLRQCLRIAALESVTDPRSLLLLKVAALFHDTGFLKTVKGHEEASCNFLEDGLKSFDFSPAEVDQMKGIIMATEIPQSPKNLLEQIICDADLDYLGRPDYAEVSEYLRRELFALGTLETVHDWMNLQLNFLSSHTYFTQSSIRDRNPLKQKNLERLKQLIQ